MNFAALSIYDWVTLLAIPVLLTCALVISFRIGYDSACVGKKTPKEPSEKE